VIRARITSSDSGSRSTPFPRRLLHKPSGSSTLCAPVTKAPFPTEPFQSSRVRFAALKPSCEVGQNPNYQFRTTALVCATASAHLRSLADDGEMPVADEEQVPVM
jgi:hypothetical protein